MKILSGWIFDVYLVGRDMAVWVIDTDGRAQMLRDTFIPAFYVGGEAKGLRALARFILDQPWDVRLSWTEFLEPHLEYLMPVLQVEVMNPNHFSAIYERVVRARPQLEYYNGPDSILRQYFVARGLHPFAFCHFVVDDEDRILAFEHAVAHCKGARSINMASSGNKKTNPINTNR